MLDEIEAMPCEQYARWQAFEMVYGLPDLNAYQAHLCQVLIAVMGGQRVKLEDLMLRPAGPAKRLTPEETVGMLGRAFGGGGAARPPAKGGRTSL